VPATLLALFGFAGTFGPKVPANPQSASSATECQRHLLALLARFSTRVPAFGVKMTIILKIFWGFDFGLRR